MVSQSAPKLKRGSGQAWWLAAIVLPVVVAYLPAIRGGFIWDDDDYVVNNTALRDAEGLSNIWFKLGAVHQYYPIVHSAFWLEYHLWGPNPLGYHLVNVLLHALSAVLLWMLLRRLKVPGAMLAAAVFALHPVHAESVAWITERKNVLSGVFYLAAMLAYFKFSPPSAAPGRPRPAAKWYVISLGLFILSLLGKSVTATLPAAILLLLWWKRPLRWKDAGAMIPFVIAGVGMGMVTVWMEKTTVGASGQDWSLSFAQRWLVAGRALWFYAGKVFWPSELTFIYPRWQIDAGQGWQYLFPAAAAAAIMALFCLRGRIGKGPLVAALFFAGTLLPALGFFDVFPMRYSFVADHFQYLASLGLIVLGASLAATAWRRLTANRASAGAAGVVLAAGLLAVLAALTWRQGRIYKNLETLWADTIRKNPACWMAYHNLGDYYLEKGSPAKAEQCYRDAIKYKPDHVIVLGKLGTLLGQQGRNQEAIPFLAAAVRARPGAAVLQYNLGVALVLDGRTDEGMTHLEEASGLGPDYADAPGKLAGMLAGGGRLAPAAQLYRKILSVRSGSASALNNLAFILATADDDSLRNPPEALKLARQAVALAGEQPATLDTLAAAQAASGLFEEAAATAQRAAALAGARGDRSLETQIQGRLELYKAGKPFRQAGGGQQTGPESSANRPGQHD